MIFIGGRYIIAAPVLFYLQNLYCGEVIIK